MGYQRQSDLKFEGMNETLSNLTQRLSLIESDVVALSKAEKRANLTSIVVSLLSSAVACSVLVCVVWT